MIVVYPHNKDDERLKIFLAGTIDNGESEDWQKGVYHSLFWMIEPLVITYGQDYVTPPGKYNVVMYSPTVPPLRLPPQKAVQR